MGRYRSTALLVIRAMLILLLAPVPGSPQSPVKLRIENPWVRCAPTARTRSGDQGGDCAAYLVVANEGPADDALVRAASPAARSAALHQATLEGSVTSMWGVEKIDIPAGGRFELKPGRYHIMLIGLTRTLKPGDRVKITVTFQNAGTLTFEAPVQ